MNESNASLRFWLEFCHKSNLLGPCTGTLTWSWGCDQWPDDSSIHSYKTDDSSSTTTCTHDAMWLTRARYFYHCSSPRGRQIWREGGRENDFTTLNLIKRHSNGQSKAAGERSERWSHSAPFDVCGARSIVLSQYHNVPSSSSIS